MKLDRTRKAGEWPVTFDNYPPVSAGAIIPPSVSLRPPTESAASVPLCGGTGELNEPDANQLTIRKTKGSLARRVVLFSSIGGPQRC